MLRPGAGRRAVQQKFPLPARRVVHRRRGQDLRARFAAELRAKTAFVLVSFDVARDTTAVLAKYRAERALDGQWTLLRGDDNAVRELAALLGVKFKQEADGSFSHSNLVTILNREGEVVHQRVGLKGGLDEAAAALVAVK
ncbi:MAG: SCO family protein [Verrucomicrobia bacterium]|nr:SCO family protein [Verrucomicrobiota bacterium]